MAYQHRGGGGWDGSLAPPPEPPPRYRSRSPLSRGLHPPQPDKKGVRHFVHRLGGRKIESAGEGPGLEPAPPPVRSLFPPYAWNSLYTLGGDWW